MIKLYRKESRGLCWAMLAAIALQCIAFSVSATPIYLNETLNNLDVKVETSLLGLKGMAFIENDESVPVLCDVVFKNGPELPVKRRGTINPGVKKVFEANMNRSIIKLVIDVKCEKSK
ncbi:hypothetical protein [Alkalimarinus alittae]|uniref:3-phosphoglycerate kinase n=1 Tax=Alkalimarinus alittae TaxID=2961619 RepID=A0ABY6N0P4_9ALTE|nr:hypothetical protein [Alkalimarinus alittae]UZE95654.1 hypothetical protein NKI27_16565 [Alkalimarinus alittae]